MYSGILVIMLLFPDVIQLLDALHIRNLSELDTLYSSLVLVGKAQAYIPKSMKRHTLIQVLPPANAYTKYAHAYIHFPKSFCCLLMHYTYCLRIANRHSMRILLVHGQVTKEFA